MRDEISDELVREAMTIYGVKTKTVVRMGLEVARRNRRGSDCRGAIAVDLDTDVSRKRTWKRR